MSKKLNGLPNNLIASFFGTARSGKDGFVIRYYDSGYMADWLANGAQKYKLDSITLDIKNGKVIPDELNIHPVTSTMQDLNIVIANELTAANLATDFIKEAKIEASFILPSRTFQVSATVTDKEGISYKSSAVSQDAMEPYFDIEEKMIKINRRKSRKSFWKRLFG